MKTNNKRLPGQEKDKHLGGMDECGGHCDRQNNPFTEEFVPHDLSYM